jgi:hypothetical protein
MFHEILHSIEPKYGVQFDESWYWIEVVYRASISATLRKGTHNQMRNNRFPEAPVREVAGTGQRIRLTKWRRATAQELK